MSNIKSWADHCSSDEESDDDRIAPPPSDLPGSISNNQLHESGWGEDEQYGQLGEGYHEPTPQRKSFALSALPDRPPYTAFLGNLSFDMRCSSDLGYELEDLLRNSSDGGGVRIRDARLMTRDGHSRGYGYVEFDTPEELLTFLHIKDPRLCGREIKVDLAESQSRSGGGGRRQSEARGTRGGRDRGDRDGRGNRGTGDDRDNGVGRGGMGDGRSDSGRGMRDSWGGGALPPKIDGSQFMGGRYARGNSSGSVGGNPGTPTTVMKRSDSSVSRGSNGMAGSMSVGGRGEAGAPRQRQSLKLLKRTKPLEVSSAASLSLQSSIFGGARPREETKLMERKTSRDDVTACATSAVEKIEFKDSDDSNKFTPKKDDKGYASKEMLKPTVDAKNDDDSDNSQKSAEAATTADISDGITLEKTTSNKPIDARKQNFDRTESRGGRGGRGGRKESASRGDNKGGDDSVGRGKREARKDGTRKSGRGVGRGCGRRENNDRGNQGEGRSIGDRRGSKSNKNGHSNKHVSGNYNGKSSLVSRAAGQQQDKVPAMPVVKEKKGLPKKANSFAAFMDDTDEED